MYFLPFIFNVFKCGSNIFSANFDFSLKLLKFEESLKNINFLNKFAINPILG